MPIKEIVTFSAGILIALFFANGPNHFLRAVRELEFKILKEATRTDNWGNPDIFRRKRVLKK